MQPRFCQKSTVGILVATALISLLPAARGQSTPGAWHEVGALKRAKGGESARVRAVAKGKESIDLTYSMPRASVQRVDIDKDRVLLGNAPLSGGAGMPRLPVIPARVLIPAGCEVDSIRVVQGRQIPIDGKFNVECAQQPFPLVPGVKPKATMPDRKVYDSDTPYPPSPYTVVGVQKKRGASVLLVNLNPVEYRPASARLSYRESMSLEVKFRPAKERGKIKFRDSSLGSLTEGVDNPEAIETYEEPVAQDGGVAPLGLCNPADHYEYVVVTSEQMKNACTDYSLTNLVAHRQAQGIPSILVTVENIYTNYSGVDNAEKLRNFIIDAYNNWETEYVLLGGDTGVVPMRKLWCVAWGGSSYQDHIPSDLYYQCLDGNYNSDNDTYWGETTDGPGGSDVDLMAEVYVGRASAETTNEMANFVYKTLAYETAPEATEYLRSALMCGEYLGFGGISDYATATMEEIRWGANTNGYATEGFASCELFEVGTLYDSPTYTWAKSNLVQIINSGEYSIINHLGHANYNYVMKFYNADADGLTNRNVMFAYSQGCIPGNFESDCVAEHLTTSTRFGMYAVVFNSRYGWGMNYSTDGPSQRFDREFWDAYFGEKIIEIGAMNADSHEDNLWDINGECIRWCFYESNLFGDPRTPMRGQFLNDSLALTPAVGFSSAGGLGGPFNPVSKTYLIQNTSTNLGLSWGASCASNWISISPTGGVLAAGGRTSFVVSVNANANVLGERRYYATLAFTNRTNGKGSCARGIDLLVNNAPRITNSSIQAGSVHPAGTLVYTAYFNDRMQRATMDSSDFALTGSVGGVYTPAAWNYDTNRMTLTLNYYQSLPEDTYTLTLYSGDGRLEDVEGLNLDGEATAWPIPPNVSGDGEEGGDFSFSFFLDAGTVAYPTPLKAKKPAGSLIYDPSVTAWIQPAGDTDRFTLSLDSNQTLTIVVDPSESTFRPRVDLLGPTGARLGGATSVTAGACALLQSAAITTPGIYTFEVGGVGVSTGRYTAQVVLNSALEEEMCDGAVNDTLATAQRLTNSFITLEGRAARGAVMGRTASGQSDYYAFQLQSNDVITLAATALVGDEPGLELYSPAGALISSGVTGFENVSRAIQNYRATVGGWYGARITGVGGDYSLVVTRNASFDLEVNSALTNAQDISATAILLGAVAASSVAITDELEPNDDGLVGCTTNDLKLANDWSGAFVAVSSTTYRAQISGKISAGYDVDWDFFRVSAGPGDSITIMENGVSLSDPYIHLYDRNGLRLAYDDDSGDGLNSCLTFTNFAYRGDYYVVGDSYGGGTGTYTLISYLTTPVPPVRADDDFVKLSAVAGDSLVIRTTTPGDGTNEFVNTLDPALELYSLPGVLLAADDNGAADHRNALLRYNVASSGVYVVRVLSSSGTGEYTVGLPRRLGPLQVLFRDPESVARENDGTVVLPVILTATTSATVQVSYSVVGGTASAGADYVAGSGTLTFQPGQISTGITVTLLNDALDEGTETFSIRLSNPVNAQLGEYPTNRCVIVDDERPLKVSFDTAYQEVTETATNAVIRLLRSGGLDGQITVDIATVDDTAKAGDDYKAVTGTVVMADGLLTTTVAIPVEQDTLDEVDESFSVTLSRPSAGVTLGVPATTTVTILDFKMPRTNMLSNANVELGISGGWQGISQVGSADWAALAGASGVYIAGWNGYSYGAISQKVNATRGTYTFAVWARREEGYNTRETQLRLEWLDASGVQVCSPTIADGSRLPADGGWHHLYVTGKCTNSNIAAVRGVFYSAFGIKLSDRCSLMIDNASLYPGVYTGVYAVANGGFEVGEGNEWRGSSWYALPERVGNGRESWAGHSADWGMALYGWDASSNDFTSRVAQNLTPGGGTHTFSVWMKRESNFLLTSADLVVEWYDASFTNKVQADSVSSCAVPADNTWHQYQVTGTCESTNLFEVRLSLLARYQQNTNNVGNRAMVMDDALFYRGATDTDQDGLPDEWESTYFTNSLLAQPGLDADGDGANNYQEYLADTCPTNVGSCFDAALDSGVGAGNDIAFYGSANRVYTLLFTTNLFPVPAWRTVQTGIRGQGGETHIQHSTGAGIGYYRLKVDLP